MALIGTLLCQHCEQSYKPEVSYYQDDYLEINCDAWMVKVLGVEVQLTPTQYRVLHCLVANKGRKLEHAQILRSVWGHAYKDDIDFVRIYIWGLRHKIEPDPRHPSYILTVPGIGYYFKV